MIYSNQVNNQALQWLRLNPVQAVHVVKGCRKYTIIHQHPSNNELDRHRGTNCLDWPANSSILKRISCPPYRPVSWLWRDCFNSSSNSKRICLFPHPYWTVSLFLLKGNSTRGTHHVPPCGSICTTRGGHEEVGWWIYLDTRRFGKGIAVKQQQPKGIHLGNLLLQFVWSRVEGKIFKT